MKLYERIENNNFDEIDRNRAIELIEGGNGHLVYNENYFKLQKENEKLKNKLLDTLKGQKVIKEETPQYIKENYIPIEKVKDNIEKEIKYHERNILEIENITMLKSKTTKEEAEIEFNKYVIVVLKKILQELIEERSDIYENM